MSFEGGRAPLLVGFVKQNAVRVARVILLDIYTRGEIQSFHCKAELRLGCMESN